MERNPTDVAVDTAGNVYVVSFAWVTKHTPTGEVIWLNDQLGQGIFGISVSGDSLVYAKFYDGSVVRLAAQDGVVLESLDLGGEGALLVDGFKEKKELLRQLVERIDLSPEEQKVEVVYRAPGQHVMKDLVAGVGFEPTTFGL